MSHDSEDSGRSLPMCKVYTLSMSELAVAVLLAHGKSVEQVGQDRKSHVMTAKTYRAAVFQKLGIQTEASLQLNFRKYLDLRWSGLSSGKY